jgi:hypothetical protein
MRVGRTAFLNDSGKVIMKRFPVGDLAIVDHRDISWISGYGLLFIAVTEVHSLATHCHWETGVFPLASPQEFAGVTVDKLWGFLTGWVETWDAPE